VHARKHTPNADVISPIFMEGKQNSKASGLKTGSAHIWRRHSVATQAVNLTDSNYRFLKNQSCMQLNRGTFIDTLHNKQCTRNVTISASRNLQVK